MIYELRNKRPKITFDLGQTELTIGTGETANLWIQTLYDRSYVATVSKSSPALSSIKVSGHHYELSSDETGIYDVQVHFTKQNLKSNILTLHVV